MTHFLFCYGTLREASIQEAVFQRTLRGTADSLAGYRMEEIAYKENGQVSVYPIIVLDPLAKAEIRGTVYEVYEKDFAACDAYEGEDYRRIKETLVSGKEAWIYVK